VPQGAAPQPLPDTGTLGSVCSIVAAATMEARLASPDSHPSRVSPGFSGQSDASSDSSHPHTPKLLLPFGLEENTLEVYPG